MYLFVRERMHIMDVPLMRLGFPLQVLEEALPDDGSKTCCGLVNNLVH